MTEVPDVFAEAKLRQKRLLEQLVAVPAVTVLGVVAPSGVGGGKLGPDEPWTLRFTLVAWRVETGDIQTRPLTIQRAVTDKELRRFRDQIKPYTVIRINARVVTESIAGASEGLLEVLVGTDACDAELNEYALRLQEPVTHEDPILGTFTLDRRIDWFSGNAVWDRAPVSLNLSASDPAGLQAALGTAYSLWRSADSWNCRIRDYAVEELLPLKNDNWLGEGEAELTANQFKDRMKLKEITVAPDGSFDFWYDDGDIFWGHAIQISGNLLEGPTNADIPG